MKILDATRYRPTDGGPSFDFSHRLFRAVWTVSWFLLASWTPPFFNGWRRVILAVFGARVARTARISSSARIWYPPNLEMAEHSCLGPRVNCYNMAAISFGPYALVSQGAHLCAGTHDIDDPDFQLYAEPITLEASCWVAADAFVGPGVTIAEGAVLGARGVAFSALQPWTVYSGNPAREIKKRHR